MIAYLLAASAVAQLPPVEAGYAHLAAGRDAAAIALIESQAAASDEPATLINLGIAYARQGDAARARTLFEAAYRSPERVELETATGQWIDSRVLARQALAMLATGAFGATGQLARK
jgi:Flp pilus assembly protein TadD